MNKKTGIRYSVNKRKPTYGWGINDADYVVQPVINGRQVLCPFYSRWVGMLTRVFCPKYKEKTPVTLTVLYTTHGSISQTSKLGWRSKSGKAMILTKTC